MSLGDSDFNARTHKKLPTLKRVCQNILIIGLVLLLIVTKVEGRHWDLTPLQMTDCPTVAVILSVMEWSPGVRGSQSRQGHPTSSASLPSLHNTSNFTHTRMFIPILKNNCLYNTSVLVTMSFNLFFCLHFFVAVFSKSSDMKTTFTDPWTPKEGIMNHTIFHLH